MTATLKFERAKGQLEFYRVYRGSAYVGRVVEGKPEFFYDSSMTPNELRQIADFIETATKHDCEKELKTKYPNQVQAQDGERWVCECGKVYVHVCDEAEGCQWELEGSPRASCERNDSQAGRKEGR